MEKTKIGKGILILLSLMLITFLTPSCAGKDNTKQASSTTAEKKVVLRMVLSSPSGDKQTIKDEEMAKRFNERAGGKYEIKVYPGGTLAKVPEYLDSVRTGAVEMMDAGLALYGGADKRLSATMIPYLFENGKAVDAAQSDLEELYDPIFQEKFNQKLLNHYYIGSIDLLTSKKPIKSLDDLEGVLIGAGDPMVVDILKQLKAVPISIPWTDFYTSLEKNVIEGVVMMTGGAIETKITDCVKHYTDLSNPPGTDVFTINMDVWNAMPKDIQDILIEESQKVAKETSAYYIQQYEKDLVTLSSMGISINKLSKEERDKFKAIFSPYKEQKLGELGDFGIKLKEIADKANSKSL